MNFPFFRARYQATALPLSPTQDQLQTRNFKRTVGFLALWLGSSLILLALCALRAGLLGDSKHPFSDGLDIFCHGGMLGLAFASIGGLIGFLFGIPRTGASSPPKDLSASDRNTSSTPNAADGAKAGPNTNLEEVSDWLTKIVLGAGLTQLVRIPEKVKAIGAHYAADFGNSQLLPELISIYSVVLGFFIGYLLTRLFLAGAFAVADRGMSPNAIISKAIRVSDVQADKQHYGEAAATLETAMTSVGVGTSHETNLLYYERLTYTSLYTAPPLGFQKVIDYINQFLQEESQLPSARLYINLACAYGQQYAWENAKENRDPAVLKESRERALDAVKKALQLDPGSKSILRYVWDPSTPKLQQEENDLEVFLEDPDFRAILG